MWSYRLFGMASVVAVARVVVVDGRYAQKMGPRINVPRDPLVDPLLGGSLSILGPNSATVNSELCGLVLRPQAELKYLVLGHVHREQLVGRLEAAGGQIPDRSDGPSDVLDPQEVRALGVVLPGPVPQ